MKNYYDLLGIAENAPDEVIKAAYKALSKKYHPDTCNETTDSTEMMKNINIAYETLSNPQKRKQYDIELKSEKNHKYNCVEENAETENKKSNSEVTNTQKENISTSTSKQNGCACIGCFTFVVLVVIALVVFTPKLFSFVNNSINTLTGKEMYKDKTSSEYCVSSFLSHPKHNLDIISDNLSPKMFEEINNYFSTQQLIEAMKNDTNIYIWEKYKNLHNEFSYQIEQASYDNENSSQVTVKINYTNFWKLLNAAFSKAYDSFQKTSKLDKNINSQTYYNTFNNSINNLYPKYKNKNVQLITFTLVKEDENWVIDSCDDIGGLLNALYAGILDKDALAEFENYISFFK